MSDPGAATFSCAQSLSNNNYLLSIISGLYLGIAIFVVEEGWA